ncbi:hypothetical protein MA5S0422_1864 [Mycobacteroides abscessus 5S-0422]|uniref:Uncharacterized protein n=4 Tax=Mycobacteroides abscessus TaxID=36809 RepID=A0A829HWY8_9MYCO|nr:hypothetical protein MASS_1926 [Mycobacteroides abscessus subsp. bolletii 50594]AIC72367.1 hypothetical protein MYCMA_09915 [Mycobacteroides abscessus subsp. massiliense str. GO 06]AMU25667.1 hypothetical protein A3N96_09805 [Mycobacteroides abscessus]EIU15511.1 hypothetical protein MA5S0304_0879 [Mycobacteroides abscessus 5S-0304]EIU16914.1 hypothetical protein MA5S0421_1130 [Mycobacteroides abscessus 5S-0421]EIU18089.1 hypothetical protein MA5S0422_1864 [Mycobacteroides abscessus 5S-0422]
MNADAERGISDDALRYDPSEAGGMVAIIVLMTGSWRMAVSEAVMATTARRRASADWTAR